MLAPRLLLTAALTFLLSIGLADPAATADPAPRRAAAVDITGPQAFDAPASAPGGLLSPTAWCGSYEVEPRMHWWVTNLRTGRTRHFEWVGAYPGTYWYRAAPGRFESTTRARCRDDVSVRTEVLRIDRKTEATTVSRGEWSRIRTGMSRERVQRIVGYPGKATPPWEGSVSVTYDMMRFWRWSVVVYRAGRVVEKYWNVGHD